MELLWLPLLGTVQVFAGWSMSMLIVVIFCALTALPRRPCDRESCLLPGLQMAFLEAQGTTRSFPCSCKDGD